MLTPKVSLLQRRFYIILWICTYGSVEIIKTSFWEDRLRSIRSDDFELELNFWMLLIKKLFEKMQQFDGKLKVFWTIK